MDLICERVIRKIVDIEDYITANALADLTGISASNIKHNLSDIKKELEKFGVLLQSIPKKGFLLVATTEQRNEIISALNAEVNRTSEFYTYRKLYILETLFLYQANYTIQLFSDELSVSRNTIQKDLELIDGELKKFHVCIKRVRNQGVILEGDEFNIRQAMINCNNSKYWNWSDNIILEDTGGMDRRISKKAYTYLTSTYEVELLEKIQAELWQLEQELGIEFVDISFGRLLEYIVITVERVRIGKRIQKNRYPEGSLLVGERMEQAAHTLLRNLLPAEKKGYPAEAQYLAARLFVASVCDDEVVEVPNGCREAVVDYLLKMETIIGTRVLSVNEDLIKELTIAFTRVKVREQFQILDWSELYRDIRKKFSGFYGICMANIDEVEESIGCRLGKDDVAWIVLLINNCINDADNRIPAMLVHGTNRHTAHYQKGRLEEALPGIYIRKNIYFKDFHPELAGDMQVIATVPFRDKIPHAIEITKHFSDKDLAYIAEELDGMEWKYQVKLLDEIKSEVFRQELMIPDLSAGTREEAIRQMAELLEAGGSVDSGFCEKVLERERFCPTSIGGEVAIPHQYRDGVLENRIVVARMRHRIRWDEEEKVKLIFLIAIRYREPLKVSILFHYLYELFENRELLDRLKKEECGSGMYDAVTDTA